MYLYIERERERKFLFNQVWSVHWRSHIHLTGDSSSAIKQQEHKPSVEQRPAVEEKPLVQEQRSPLRQKGPSVQEHKLELPETKARQGDEVKVDFNGEMGMLHPCCKHGWFKTNCTCHWLFMG